MAVWKQTLLCAWGAPHASSHKGFYSGKNPANGPIGVHTQLGAVWPNKQNVHPASATRQAKLRCIGQNFLPLVADVPHGLHEERQVRFSAVGNFVVNAIDIFVQYTSRPVALAILNETFERLSRAPLGLLLAKHKLRSVD